MKKVFTLSFALILCIALTSCSPSVKHALWNVYTLEELAEVAELAFTGTVKEASYGFRTYKGADGSEKTPCVFYTIDVTNIYKGQNKIKGDSINIKVPGNDPSTNGTAQIIVDDVPVPLDINKQYLFVLSAYDDVEGYDENNKNYYPSILNPYQSIFDLETDKPVNRIQVTGNGRWEENTSTNQYMDFADFSANEVIEQIKKTVSADEWGNALTIRQFLDGRNITKIEYKGANNGIVYTIYEDKINEYISRYDNVLLKENIRMRGKGPNEDSENGWPVDSVVFYENETKILELLPLEFMSGDYLGHLLVGFYDQDYFNNWNVKICKYNTDHDNLINIISWDEFID